VDPYRTINKLNTNGRRGGWGLVVGVPIEGLGEVGRPREPRQGTRDVKLQGSFPYVTKSSTSGGEAWG
jgi:hypothetical protein